MAAVINSYPTLFALINQPLIYTIGYSTTLPDRFIVEVFQEGITAAISTLYLTPNTSGKAFFNLSEVVRERVYVDSYQYNTTNELFNLSTKPFTTATYGLKKFTVKVGTYLNGVVDLNDDSDFTLIQGGAGQLSEPNPRSLADYFPATQNSSQVWLTDRVPDADNIIHINVTDYSKQVIAFINDSVYVPTNQTKVMYRLNNSSGSQLGSYGTWTLNAANGAQLPNDSPITKKLTYMGIGIKNLLHVDVGSRPESHATWSYYDIFMAKADGSRLGSIIRCHRVCPNQIKHNYFTLFWDNSLGGWDSLTFSGRTEQTDMTTSKTFSRKVGNYSGTSLAFEKLAREFVPYQVTGKTKYKLTSLDFSFADIKLLKYAIRGKSLFLKEEGVSIPCMPVNLDTKSYDVKEAFSGVFSVSLTVTLAQTIRC